MPEAAQKQYTSITDNVSGRNRNQPLRIPAREINSGGGFGGSGIPKSTLTDIERESPLPYTRCTISDSFSLAESLKSSTSMVCSIGTTVGKQSL